MKKWLLGSKMMGAAPWKSADLPGNHELPKWEEVLFWFTWRKTTQRKGSQPAVGARVPLPEVHPQQH